MTQALSSDKTLCSESPAARLRRCKDELRDYLIVHLGILVLRVLQASLRWKWSGFDGERRRWVDGPPLIGVFWHNRQLMMPWVFVRCRKRWSRRTLYMLISEHRDGRLIARAIKTLGISSVAGSSTHGGSRALRELIEKVKGGDHAAITPDGPRGPRGELKTGVIRLAMATGAPIVPVAYGASRVWRFKSWDGMLLPRPFSRGAFVMGEPLFIPPDINETEIESFRLQVQKALDAVTAEADRLAAG